MGPFSHADSPCGVPAKETGLAVSVSPTQQAWSVSSPKGRALPPGVASLGHRHPETVRARFSIVGTPTSNPCYRTAQALFTSRKLQLQGSLEKVVSKGACLIV